LFGESFVRDAVVKIGIVCEDDEEEREGTKKEEARRRNIYNGKISPR
jgi:hypothetical protein